MAAEVEDDQGGVAGAAAAPLAQRAPGHRGGVALQVEVEGGTQDGPGRGGRRPGLGGGRPDLGSRRPAWGEQRPQVEQGVQRLGRAALAVGDPQLGELSPGQRVLGGREHPPPGQVGEHALAAADGAVAAGRRERVHPRRRLRQRREEGDLGPGEVRDRFVEVAARGVGDAVDAVAVGDDAQVVAQHLARAVALGEEDGGDRLGHLAQVAARARALHARHLHGDRRRPRDPAARPQVLQQRPGHRQRIDAGMGAEAAVLERQGRGAPAAAAPGPASSRARPLRRRRRGRRGGDGTPSKVPAAPRAARPGSGPGGRAAAGSAPARRGGPALRQGRSRTAPARGRPCPRRRAPRAAPAAAGRRAPAGRVSAGSRRTAPARKSWPRRAVAASSFAAANAPDAARPASLSPRHPAMTCWSLEHGRLGRDRRS